MPATLSQKVRRSYDGIPYRARVVHFREHAYCVAGNGMAWATFAYPNPPADPAGEAGIAVISSGDMSGVRVGKFYPIAYVSTETHGEWVLLAPRKKGKQ